MTLQLHGLLKHKIMAQQFKFTRKVTIDPEQNQFKFEVRKTSPLNWD